MDPIQSKAQRLEAEYENKKQKLREQTETAESRRNNEAETNRRKSDEELKEFKTDQVNRYEQRVRSAKDDFQKSTHENSAKLYDRYGKMEAEQNLERARSAEYLAEQSRIFKDRSKAQNQELDTRLHKVAQAAQETAKADAEAQRVSRNNEQGYLRESIQQMNQAKKDTSVLEASRRQNAYEELESDFNTRTQKLISEQELEKSRIKERDEYSEDAIYQKAQDAMSDQKRKTALLIRSMEARHQDDVEWRDDEFLKNLGQQKDRYQKGVATQEATHEKAFFAAREANEKAMNKMAESSQQTLKRTVDDANAQTNYLSDKLQEMRTSPDASVISPGAEEKLRSTYNQDHQKTLNAAQTSHQRSEQAIRKAWKEDQTNLSADLQKEKLDKARIAANLADQHRRDLANLSGETSQKLKSSMFQAQSDRQALMETLEDRHQGEQIALKRQLGESLADREDALLTRIKDHDAEMQYQLASIRRSHQTTVQDMNRAQEKALNDQKGALERQHKEILLETQKNARNLEKRLKQALDEQARSYEHRLAESEQFRLEREKNLSRMHQDELEKVKKSHALLMAKKS